MTEIFKKALKELLDAVEEMTGEKIESVHVNKGNPYDLNEHGRLKRLRNPKTK